MLEKKKIAIYSRKSKFTGKGESIENQIEMCKNYLKQKDLKLVEEQIIVYEDEGYSGANTDRPQFQKMLTDMRKGFFQTVIVYRLDRVSRNVLDFCKLKDEFQKYDVEFISIKESFDTSSPMGNAMMMISSVFAQLERDTIAERIRDNMYELAKTGRWLGGNTPYGFLSIPIETIDENGKKRKQFQLALHPEESEIVKIIFKKYLQLHSLANLERYLAKENILARNQKPFSRFTLKGILTNLVYVFADKDIYHYLLQNQIPFYGEYLNRQSSFGLLSYHKRYYLKDSQTSKRKNCLRSQEEWIVTIGKHPGLLSGKEWIQVQNILNQNSFCKQNRIAVKNQALLSGIVLCGKCHKIMRPRILKTIHSSGKYNFSYLCTGKEKSHGTICNQTNISGINLEQKVIDFLLSYPVSSQKIQLFVEQELENCSNSWSENQYYIQKLKKNEQKINTLIRRLALVEDSLVSLLEKEIHDLQLENQKLEKELINLECDAQIKNLDLSILDFPTFFNQIPFSLQKQLIQNTCEHIKINDDDVEIYF